MDFNIAAGSNANLPKETVTSIIDLAIEKSVLLKMIDARGNLIEVPNEGTLPVTGSADSDKVYKLSGTADITTLTEQAFDVREVHLDPVEAGQWMRLKDKQVKTYPEHKLEYMFETKMGKGMAGALDKLSLIGDTSIVDATGTNLLKQSDGIATIAADSTLCAQTPVSYSTSNSQAICNVINEAVGELGLYGDDEFAEDLVCFVSSAFLTAARNSADKNVIGFETAPYAATGSKNTVFIHGIPLVKRAQLSGNKAVLANMNGAYAGYYGDMSVEVQREASRRGNLMVMTYFIDYKWAFIDENGKALGIIEIDKTS